MRNETLGRTIEKKQTTQTNNATANEQFKHELWFAVALFQSGCAVRFFEVLEDNVLVGMPQDFKDTIIQIINKCKKYKIPIGDHIVDPKISVLEKRIKEGFRFIAFGTDGVFLNNSSKSPINTI